jgi:hypothetical protein
LSHPHWLRVWAVLCVLLVGVVSTVQAAHVHGEWLTHHGKRVSLPMEASQGQGEEHCPLCVAMHSSLPVTMQVVPEPLRQVAQTLTTRVLAAPDKLWSFAMFSRPPPVVAQTFAAGEASNDVSSAAAAAV